MNSEMSVDECSPGVSMAVIKVIGRRCVVSQPAEDLLLDGQVDLDHKYYRYTLPVHIIE